MLTYALTAKLNELITDRVWKSCATVLDPSQTKGAVVRITAPTETSVIARSTLFQDMLENNGLRLFQAVHDFAPQGRVYIVVFPILASLINAAADMSHVGTFLDEDEPNPQRYFCVNAPDFRTHDRTCDTLEDLLLSNGYSWRTEATETDYHTHYKDVYPRIATASDFTFDMPFDPMAAGKVEHEMLTVGEHVIRIGRDNADGWVICAYGTNSRESFIGYRPMFVGKYKEYPTLGLKEAKDLIEMLPTPITRKIDAIKTLRYAVNNFMELRWLHEQVKKLDDEIVATRSAALDTPRLVQHTDSVLLEDIFLCEDNYYEIDGERIRDIFQLDKDTLAVKLGTTWSILPAAYTVRKVWYLPADAE